jgi:hypothetical protein
MKKWVDADKIIRMVTDLEDHRLRELEKQMQEKPNFNHEPTAEEKKKKKRNRGKTWRL